MLTLNPVSDISTAGVPSRHIATATGAPTDIAMTSKIEAIGM